jgi:hypothetical protein
MEYQEPEGQRAPMGQVVMVGQTVSAEEAEAAAMAVVVRDLRDRIVEV